MASDATVNAILDAAELLFAKQGYDATSVREITREAGVNVAAVHYHFGDKPAVLRAVTDRIVQPMNERRLQMLDLAEAAARPDTPSIAEVVEAFVRPDFDTMRSLQDRGPTVARFIGRIYRDPTEWIQTMAIEQFAEVGRRFSAAIAAETPGLDDDEIGWRLNQLVTLLVTAFASWPIPGRTAEEADQEARRLIDFGTAGITGVAGATGITDGPTIRTNTITTRKE